MRERPQAVGPRRRGFRQASSVTALVLGGLVLVMTAASWPLAGLAHLNIDANTGGAPWWAFTPLGLVGLVVAWRKPANPLGWCFIGLWLVGALSQDGSLYAIADYRLRHGTLPLGWVAMLVQPTWAIGIVLIGLAVLIFPDGRSASPLLRRVLYLYLALALAWMATAYAITVDVIVRHRIRVDVGGSLVSLNVTASSPHWWNAFSYAVFVVLALCWLLVLAGQVASYRRSSGERRQQLKWLLAGFVTCLVAVVLAITLGSAPGVAGVIGHLAILGIFAVPVSMAVAILKYRLYDIDRILSRTLAYAIVTGLLVGVYAGLVLLATGVLAIGSSVAVAASTLVAVALFSPLRRRVQRAVDRRFNRARYDADQTIAAFAARLKDAVDLNSVRDDLATVVNRTLEPTHVSVWINEQGNGRVARLILDVGRPGGPRRAEKAWHRRAQQWLCEDANAPRWPACRASFLEWRPFGCGPACAARASQGHAAVLTPGQRRRRRRLDLIKAGFGNAKLDISRRGHLGDI